MFVYNRWRASLQPDGLRGGARVPAAPMPLSCEQRLGRFAAVSAAADADGVSHDLRLLPGHRCFIRPFIGSLFGRFSY